TCRLLSSLFFLYDTATTEIYTLSLHDALPICAEAVGQTEHDGVDRMIALDAAAKIGVAAELVAIIRAHQPVVVQRVPQTGNALRSEEHTSELQSRENLVCRLLLEKKKKNKKKK